MTADPARSNPSFIRRFISSEAAGGLVLMGTAVLALIIANSPLAETYFDVLGRYVGGLSVLHWINDALMAVFFLMVGLEIKREVITGQFIHLAAASPSGHRCSRRNGAGGKSGVARDPA